MKYKYYDDASWVIKVNKVKQIKYGIRKISNEGYEGTTWNPTWLVKDAGMQPSKKI